MLNKTDLHNTIVTFPGGVRMEFAGFQERRSTCFVQFLNDKGQQRVMYWSRVLTLYHRGEITIQTKENK